MSKPKISVVLPILHKNEDHLHMTWQCLQQLRWKPGCDDIEVIIVETESAMLEPHKDSPILDIDKYIHIDKRTRYTTDFNIGCDAAEGDFIVHIGNDVLLREGWANALLRPFELFPDCGVTTLAVVERKTEVHAERCIGPGEPLEFIVEGMYGPIMMFRKGWLLDEDYIGAASDNDLVMRMYEDGLRAYRNCAVVVEHLDNQTWKDIPDDANMDEGIALFEERWKGSPWLIYHLMRKGLVMYGQEHVGMGIKGYENLKLAVNIPADALEQRIKEQRIKEQEVRT